jgi:hypothetical protein
MSGINTQKESRSVGSDQPESTASSSAMVIDSSKIKRPTLKGKDDEDNDDDEDNEIGTVNENSPNSNDDGVEGDADEDLIVQFDFEDTINAKKRALGASTSSANLVQQNLANISSFTVANSTNLSINLTNPSSNVINNNAISMMGTSNFPSVSTTFGQEQQNLPKINSSNCFSRLNDPLQPIQSEYDAQLASCDKEKMEALKNKKFKPTFDMFADDEEYESVRKIFEYTTEVFLISVYKYIYMLLLIVFNRAPEI